MRGTAKVGPDSTSSGEPQDRRIPVSRRTFIQVAGAGFLFVATGPSVLTAATVDGATRLARPAQEGRSAGYWWQRYPTCIDLGERPSAKEAAALHARMVMDGYAADPTWGPYAQRLTEFIAPQVYADAKEAGLRWITWVEAFGDCMLYAAALERQPDGSYPWVEGHPEVARLVRNAWNWEASDAPSGNTFRWVGLHNTTNDEDLARPLFTRERTGLPTPRYPDGRAAVGWLPDGQYPVSARIYDACCAKDINGNLDFTLDAFPVKANGTDHATGKPLGSNDGLYRVVVDTNNRDRYFREKKLGDVAYCSGISIGKDIAAPFWIDYIRTSVQEIIRLGVDGVWCDNFSPWDNFGQFSRAFGDWSEHRFREFLAVEFHGAELTRMGVTDAVSFDVREYLKRKASEFGAADPANTHDPKWTDARWLDDPVWNTYKAFKQRVGREGLHNFYGAIKDEARKAGRPDFVVAGNDMPIFGLGWVRDDYLDMVCSEGTASWHLTTGSRGIMIPPLGKYAVVYRAALEHQKGPYVTARYYLQGPYEQYRGRPEIAKVLMAEAFANSTFLMSGGNPAYPGTPEAVAWWNDFVTRHEAEFGRRRAIADVGILFSPDNQLWVLAPGGPPDFDRQPHSFGHWGFATAMIDAHIAYRVVTDWRLNAASLAGLRAFIIPDAECLDDSALPVLEKWVRLGGRLVVTGWTGAREGAAGFFRKRARPLLEALVGVDMSPGAARASLGSPEARPTVHIRKLGRGTIVWTPAPTGMEYYLNEKERPARLAAIVRMVGQSGLLEGGNLPSTVGAFAWESDDGKALFADLVNYDLDPESDTVTPAQGLRFALRLTGKWSGVEAATLSPDEAPPAAVTVRDGGAAISLPKLTHYASVRLTGR